MKNMFLNYDSPIVLDLETTSANPEECRILEIGALSLGSGKSIELPVRTPKGWKPGEEHPFAGVCLDDWNSDALDELDAVERFLDWIKDEARLERRSNRGNPYFVAPVIGWNIVRFDKPVLIRIASEATGEDPPWVSWDPRAFDAMQLAMWLNPGCDSYKLEDQARAHGRDVSRAHEALFDCHLTATLAATWLSQIFNSDSLPAWVSEWSLDD